MRVKSSQLFGEAKNRAVYLAFSQRLTQVEYFSLQQRDVGSSLQESSRKLAVDIRHCIDPNRRSPVREYFYLLRQTTWLG